MGLISFIMGLHSGASTTSESITMGSETIFMGDTTVNMGTE